MSFRMCLSCALLVGVSGATTAQGITKAPVVWVASIQGAVSFQPSGFAGSDGWVPAELNHPIAPGDRIATVGGGRAELRSDNGNLVIQGESCILFQRLDEQAVLFKLDQGSLDLGVQKSSTGRQFEVATGNLSLMFAGAGQFRVETGPDGNTKNLAAQGGDIQAAFENQKAFWVKGGQTARVSATDYTVDGQVIVADTHPGTGEGTVPDNSYTRNSDTHPPDTGGYPGGTRPAYGRPYDSPNAYQLGSYPPDADPGADQLRNYGDWRQSPYGIAWYPQVAADWAPYTTGHWNWIDPWGWTWVDSAAWGFTPFHYGRWGRSAVAWYWVPGPPVYSPATVAWVGGPSGVGVGWFPLGPGEVIGSMRYVNRGYVTVVSHQTFVGAMPVAEARLRVGADFGLRSPAVGSMAIVPTRASVLGNAMPGPHPSLTVLNRTAFARVSAGGTPIPFGRRQQLWARNPGHPISQTEMQTAAFGGNSGFRVAGPHSGYQTPAMRAPYGQQQPRPYPPSQRAPLTFPAQQRTPAPAQQRAPGPTKPRALAPIRQRAPAPVITPATKR